MHSKKKIFSIVLLFLLVNKIWPQESFIHKYEHLKLTPTTAESFSKLALKCVQKEYPNKLDHVMNDGSEVQSPLQLHPAFYGCFDWHSSVHGHWMLIKLLKLFPELINSNEIRKALNENLSLQNIDAEVKYLNQPNRKSFERTYGWAWLLKLAEELYTWDDLQGQNWYQNLKPLADAIAKRYLEFLPKQNYPIRTGVHPNTAFGISFALDYARSIKNSQLENLLIERAKTYYSDGEEYDAKWEPGGEDFFSPSLMEAELMSKIYEQSVFERWLIKFIPKLGETKNILEPAIVTDRTDPKLVHLDGLNLSRAWCMLIISNRLSSSNKLKNIIMNSALAHAEAGLKYISSGNYEGEHWLASFAVYMLSTLNME